MFVPFNKSDFYSKGSIERVEKKREELYSSLCEIALEKCVAEDQGDAYYFSLEEDLVEWINQFRNAVIMESICSMARLYVFKCFLKKKNPDENLPQAIYGEKYINYHVMSYKEEFQKMEEEEKRIEEEEKRAIRNNLAMEKFKSMEMGHIPFSLQKGYYSIKGSLKKVLSMREELDFLKSEYSKRESSLEKANFLYHRNANIINCLEIILSWEVSYQSSYTTDVYGTGPGWVDGAREESHYSRHLQHKTVWFEIPDEIKHGDPERFLQWTEEALDQEIAVLQSLKNEYGL